MKFEELDISEAISCFGIKSHECENGIRHIYKENFSEARIFALLKWKFGAPNGFLSLVLPRGTDPDAPYKWHYVFDIEGLTIHVMRSWMCMEIHVHGDKPSKTQVRSFFENNLKKHNANVLEILDSLEDYILLVNPFYRHKRISDISRLELEKIDPKKPYYPEDIIIDNERSKKKHLDSYLEYTKKIELQNFFSISLAIHNAFAAEAYLNLMIALLIKDEVRKDRDEFSRFLRFTWKEIIKNLVSYCNHLKKEPDIGNTRIREVGKLFNLRNRIVHSYPDQEVLLYEKIRFFQNAPLLDSIMPLDLYQSGVVEVLPTKEESLKTIVQLQGFIDFIDEIIEEKALKEFQFFASSNPLGFNVTKNIYSVPFADYVAKVFFLKANAKDKKHRNLRRR